VALGVAEGGVGFGGFCGGVGPLYYVPTLDTWFMLSGPTRRGHTMTRLSDGRVLLAGGETNPNCPQGPTVLVNVYDPGTRTWSSGPPLPMGLSEHAAVLLEDGRLLVAGGGNRAFLFDPGSDGWSEVGTMSVVRYGAALELLPGGDALIAGGSGSSALTERFHPQSQVWSPGGTLGQVRSQPALTPACG